MRPYLITFWEKKSFVIQKKKICLVKKKIENSFLFLKIENIF